jgi:hypothetical protein
LYGYNLRGLLSIAQETISKNPFYSQLKAEMTKIGQTQYDY